MLLRSKGLAIRTDQGWELSPQGVDWLKNILEAQPGTGPRISLAKSLRNEAEKLTSLETKAFVLEAVECFERKLYRAAVVLSWQGALGLLYDNVIKTHLNTFNAEAKRRNSKWKSAVTRDDLALMKESDFLDVSEAISMIGKSVKKELKNALDFRNGCGHPNSLKISENMVSAHIENLILNVFSPFGQ